MDRIESERLILRKWKDSDIDDLVEGLNNLNVSKWLAFVPYPYTREDAINYIDHTKNSNDIEFAIVLKSENKVIGGTLISNISDVHKTAGGGIWISEKYWGYGYGTEAFSKRIEYAFDYLNLRRLENGYFKDNIKSWKMQERFGYKNEGVRRKKYISMATGKLEDEYVTGLLREEWIRYLEYEDKKRFLQNVCMKLDLGDLVEFTLNIGGGITNKIHKISTLKGDFAIKVINKSNIEKNKELLANIERSEEIASIALANRVNAIPANMIHNKYVQYVDNENILVYNWCEGKILLTKEINLKHVQKIAKQLNILHNIEVKHKINISKYEKINFKKYYELLKNNDANWCNTFVENFEHFEQIYTHIYSCYEKINVFNSYVHKDLNRKNIMWNENLPYIIDWETATVGNRYLDFFNSAWFLTADVDEKKYTAFCKEYFCNNIIPEDIENLAYAAIIDECNWLEYSLKRALKIQSNDEYEINLGKESVYPSLNEIINYYDKVPLMLKIIRSI